MFQYICTLSKKLSYTLDVSDLPRNYISETYLCILQAVVKWATIPFLTPLLIKSTLCELKTSQDRKWKSVNRKIRLYPDSFGFNNPSLGSRIALSSHLLNVVVFDTLCRKSIFWQDCSGKPVSGKKTLVFWSLKCNRFSNNIKHEWNLF